MTKTLSPADVPAPSDPTDPTDPTGLELFEATDLDPGALAGAYARNGAVQIRGLLSSDEVAALRESFTDHMAGTRPDGEEDQVPGEDPLKRWPRMIHPHRGDHAPGRLARQWLLHERVAGVVRQATGPVWAAQSMFYFKPPGARGQAMHQDNLFLQSHPETCVAAWIAVDDCDADNGALAVVPGTHRYDIVCPEEADVAESFTSIQVSVPEGMSVVQTDMRAGDCLVFHGSMVHGSKPNTSADRFRRSLIFHYVPEGSREVAQMYQPLLSLDGDEVWIDRAADGGACGEEWAVTTNH